jgi:hypothetical protein
MAGYGYKLFYDTAWLMQGGLKAKRLAGTGTSLFHALQGIMIFMLEDAMIAKLKITGEK